MKKVDVRCYISKELKRRIKLHAVKHNVTVSRWLLWLIEKELKKTERR